MCIVIQPSFDHSLFIATDKEVTDLVDTYKRHAKNGYNREDLMFAKAVCCLKLICIVKVRSSMSG